jgi:hypothetical protein
MKRLDYPGLSLAVVLDDAATLEPLLDRVIRGWLPRRRALSAREGRALTRAGQRRSHLRLTPEGFEARSFYMEPAMRGLGGASAICTVLADLAQDWFESRPGTVALHCAAVRFGDRLVALTGPKRAGKSTLVTRLTAEPDLEVFCDDVLPVLPDGRGVALGIAPRLRLPLPDRASPAFRAHVARWMGPRDDRYGYVCAPTVAPHGATAPLAAFVLLDRREGGPARLHHLAPDDAVHHLMAQNMADLGGAAGTFAMARRLAGGLTCLRLVYADLDDAVALLRRAFAAGGGLDPSLRPGPALADPPPPPPEAAPVRPDAVWRRAGSVAVRGEGASAFLWAPGSDTVWRLNLVGRAVWAMLTEPASAAELAGALAEVFPAEPPARLEADVARLIGGLAAAGFVTEAQPAAAD